MSDNITLYPHQIQHYHRILDILSSQHAYIDTSPTGRGKTITTIAIAITCQLSLIVICPLTIVSLWQKEAKKYGVTILTIITYQTLRGTSLTELNHDLLSKEGDNFYPTQKYIQHVKNGILLVFDEFHNLKNPTIQTQASHTLVRALVQLNSCSRIALLSNTPFCKPIHSESICKMLGIITYDKLYNYDINTHQYHLLGIQQVINTCKELDPLITDNLVRPLVIDKNTAHTLCYQLYVQILKRFVSSAMPSKDEEDSKIIKDCKNGYYDMSQTNIDKLSKASSLLSRAVNYHEGSQTVYVSCGAWGDIARAQIMSEEAILDTFAELAAKVLSQPQSKVIIYLNYVDHMLTLYSLLEKYNPMLMYGQTKPKDRDIIINNFQLPNDSYRLLISNIKVGGIGINLDDRDGNWPRYMYISPSYNIIDIHQATGRIYRLPHTKSSATVRIIYSKQVKHQTKILHALARKSETLREIQYNSDDDILFPGEYPSYIDGEQDIPIDISTIIQQRKLHSPIVEEIVNI